MFKQLAYSGTLEVTQIRKAGLNVRRPLKHFYQYYKICADDPQALKAGTVTKRAQLLLKQLGLDEGKCARPTRIPPPMPPHPVRPHPQTHTHTHTRTHTHSHTQKTI